MNDVRLGRDGEFDRIRAIRDALGEHAGPLGDDTAAIPDGRGQLVASTDVSVEGVHFRLDWIDPGEAGFRATVAALSDLAAAAALPAGILVALTVPERADPDLPVRVMRGVGAAAGASATKVVGGDLSSGPCLTIGVTVLGHAPRPMSRRGAQSGDGIWVTGWVGGAHAALRDWQAGKTPEPTLRELFVNPLPRLAPARWLAEQGATAMIDLSDGIAGDAQHLAAASGVRLEIDLTAIPLAPAVPVVATRYGEDPAIYGASGGEDYELLLTLPPSFDRAAAERCFAATGVPIARIGNVVEGGGAVLLRDGAAVDVSSFSHAL